MEGSSTILSTSTEVSSSVTTETLPLTTMFTQPSDCSTHWTYENTYYNSWPGGILMQNLVGEGLDSTCFPSGWEAFGRAYTEQVWSPGACPARYKTVTSTSASGTITAICCYENYSYTGVFSTINHGGSESHIFAGCTSSFSSGSVTSVDGRISPSAGTFLSPTVVTGPITMWAQPITILYQFRDLAIYPALTSTATTLDPSSPSDSASSSITGASTASSTGTDAPTPTSSASNGSGLSTGAKTGIGVGVAAAILTILALSTFLWRAKRSKKANPVAPHQLLPGYPQYTSSHEPSIMMQQAPTPLSSNYENTLRPHSITPVEMPVDNPGRK